MISPLKDGLIDNWDLFEKLVDHSYKRHIRSDSEMHPVLMSEAPVGFVPPTFANLLLIMILKVKLKIFAHLYKLEHCLNP